LRDSKLTSLFTGNNDSYGSSNPPSSGNNYGSNDDSYGSSNPSGNNKNDSTAGKLFEKAGNLLKNDGLVQKGQAKRAQAGNDDYSSGNTGSYGSGNNNNDY